MPLVSVCIITLGRDTLYRTLTTVFNQVTSFDFEVILILQWKLDLKLINRINTKNIPYKIYSHKCWLWFGYYRNQAQKKSSWDILAWIDDDEWSISQQWLQVITEPIRDLRYFVVTSGCYIETGQWYLTDSISSLWWPGWGSIGFEKMWTVYPNWTTNHLCSGNFAIKKLLQKEIGFLSEAIYGGEDNNLAKNLNSRRIPIFYEPNATLSHVSRDFKSSFVLWADRAKSFSSFTQKKSSYEEPLLFKFFRILKNLFIFDRYLPWKIFFFTIKCWIFIVIFVKNKFVPNH